MKFAAALALLATAEGFVLPNIFLETFERITGKGRDDAAVAWWDSIAAAKDSLLSGVDAVEHAAHITLDAVLAGAQAADEDLGLAGEQQPPRWHRGSGKDGDDYVSPPTANLTIYQLISKSNHTTKFAKLVDEYDDLVKLLNSTDAGNYTLFVPVDAAFEHIPHDKKPSKEFIEKVLKYHVANGSWPAGRVLTTPTLPTIVEEAMLGGEPQRLRASVGFGGVHINFYSKVIAANIVAKNGVVHAVSSIIVPPPFVGKELALLPSLFSTLLHAYDKTDFVEFIHHVETTGSTVFAPSNKAFEKLGPRANAFLFNTERGLKFLKALLKYQIVANATLYSNALYEAPAGAEGADAALRAAGVKHSHVELTTLLNGTKVGVDITRLGSLVDIKLNGWVPVVVRDAVALNGVIHVVGRVPVPPRKPHLAGPEDDGEMEVEDLVARLAPYVEGTKSGLDEELDEDEL